MSKYAIATFIVCSVEGFVCYLIGYMVGITHDKRTITHECVKDKHDKTEPSDSENPNNCETCKWGEWYRQGYDITMMDDECGGCCSWNSKWTPKDEPQTERSE